MGGGVCLQTILKDTARTGLFGEKMYTGGGAVREPGTLHYEKAEEGLEENRCGRSIRGSRSSARTVPSWKAAWRSKGEVPSSLEPSRMRWGAN